MTSPTDPESDLLQLGFSSTPSDRLNATQAFLARWYRTQPAPLVAQLPSLPPILQDFYRATNGLPVSTQNRLISPLDLKSHDGRIVFYVESQDVCRWAVEAVGEDPAVWRQDLGEDRWNMEEERLSGFLIQLTLFEAIAGAPFGGAASDLTASSWSSLCSQMVELPVKPWSWPAYPGRFFARTGALLFTCPTWPNEEAHSAWLGAVNSTSIAFAKDLVDETWDFYNA